jgi:hypothetical protein
MLWLIQNTRNKRLVDMRFSRRKNKKVFLRFSCHLQHHLIFNVLGGDRYFRTCHPLVTHTSNKLLLGAENTW